METAEKVGDNCKPLRRKPSDIIKKFHCQSPGCSCSFNRPWKLENHMRSHQNQKPFSCSFLHCLKSYQSASHLRRHVKISHGQEERFPCSILMCDKSFGCISSLKTHLRRHELENNLACDTCKMTFKSKKSFAIHQNTHLGILPYPCPQCQAQFKLPSLLSRHMKSHMARKCPEDGCPVVLNSWNEIRAHIALEHTEAYKCDLCSKTYRHKSQLREHVLSHLPAEKRAILYCPYFPCDRAYYHERNLQWHVRFYHSKPRVYCNSPSCSKSFTDPDRLKSHRAKMHKQTVPEAQRLMAKLTGNSFLPESCLLKRSDDEIEVTDSTVENYKYFQMDDKPEEILVKPLIASSS